MSMNHKGNHMKTIILSILLLSTVLLANDPLIIKGEVSYKTSGTLYVILVDKATFGKQSQGLQVVQKRVNGKGSISYRFDAVASGTYGVKCFLDKNGNGKLDRGALGPKEPWGMSFKGKRPLGRPKFSQIAHKINNSTDISVVVK